MELRILGPLQLLDDGGGPVPVGGAKPTALLAVLAVHTGRTVAASTLQQALWGDAPPPSATRTLQAYVSRLRGVTARGSGLRITSSEYGVRLEVEPGALDADRALQLSRSAAAAAAAGDPAAALRHAEDALALWRGPSLAEFAQEPFAIAEAGRLDELRLSLIECRVEQMLATGNHAGVIADVERLTTEHPLRERLWEGRMLALYRCGRQAEALRCYQALRSVLADAGLQPSRSVRRLEASILAQDETLAPPAPPAPPAAPAAPAPPRAWMPRRLELALARADHVAGREAELEGLRSQWAEAAAGNRTAVVVTGEPGIGKTTLAAVLAAEVRAGDGIVLYGRCDEHVRVPFQPFAEALRPQVVTPAAGTSPLELLWRAERDGTTSPWAAQQERWLLFESVVEFLDALTNDGAALLVVDDLHWADEPTLLLLRHVLCAQHPSRLMVLATYRDTEAGAAERIRRALGEVHRDQAVEHVTLGGLGAEEVRWLVSRLTPRTVDEQPEEELVDALRRASGGNPFFLRELLHQLPADAGVEWRRLPPSVLDVALHRLEGLSAGARSVLEVVAVLGDSSRLPLLQATAAPDLSATEVCDGVDEALSSGLLVDTGGSYEFSHAIVGRALRHEMPLARRSALHRSALTALEALGAEDDHADALAFHACAAAAEGLGDSAERHTLAAAAAAERRLAFEQAVALLERGLAALELVPGAATARCNLLLARAGCIARSSSARSAVSTAIDDAATAARAMRSSQHLADVAILAMRSLTFGESDEAATALVDEALAALPAGDVGRRSALLAERAYALALLDGESDASHAASAEAVALAGASASTVRARLIHGRLSALLGAPAVDERERLAQELLMLGDAETEPSTDAMGQLHLAAIELERGRREGFDLHAAALAAEADRSGSWYPTFFALAHRRMIALLEGRWDEAEKLGDDVLRLAGDSNSAFLIWAGQQAVLDRDTGRVPEMAALLDAAVDASSSAPAVQLLIASARARMGDDAAARAVLADHEGGRFTLRHDRIWSLSAALLAELLLDHGGAAGADMLEGDLRVHAGLVIAPGGGGFCFGAADRYLGMLAAVTGREHDAVELFERALRIEHGLRSPPSVARTGSAYARALILLGAPRTSWEPIAAAARQEALGAGMGPLVSDVDALIDRRA